MSNNVASFQTPRRGNLSNEKPTLQSYAEALTSVSFLGTVKKAEVATKLALSNPQAAFYRNQSILAATYKCDANRNDGDKKTTANLQAFLVHAFEIALKCPETERDCVIYLLSSLLTMIPSLDGYGKLTGAIGIPEDRWADESLQAKPRKTAFKALFWNSSCERTSRYLLKILMH